MTLHEYAGNLHMHTRASDGTGSHADLVDAAAAGGLDWIIVTDHNVRPTEAEGWQMRRSGRRVLLLIGEEVHDVEREQQANHLLCLGIREDVSLHARDPQALVDAVNAQGGAAFIAHPIEYGTIMVDEELPWVDWHVRGYAGIELWNYMSEFKSVTTSRLRSVIAALFPHWFIRGPFPETLALWDRLLSERDEPTIAIGSTDAHAILYRMGPLRRVLFPYRYLFRTVNTHILCPEPLAANKESDREIILGALRAGRCWVGYDAVASTAGTRFQAVQGERRAQMGDTLRAADGPITFHLVVPGQAELRLLRNGDLVAQTHDAAMAHADARPGVYRAEAWRRVWGGRRGWVFTNPIWVR